MDNNLNLKKKYHDYILTDGGGECIDPINLGIWGIMMQHIMV